MPFFIKEKSRSSSSNYCKSNVKKRKLVSKYRKDPHEEIVSSEDESGKANQYNEFNSLSDSENEIVEQKRLCLAKVYLQEIIKKENKKFENKYAGVTFGSLTKTLKENYLQSIGAFRDSVANRYIGADVNNIVVMQSRNHKRCITCFCLTNKFIFAGSKDCTIIKWCRDKNKEVGSIPYNKYHIALNKVMGHYKIITALAAPTDGKFLAASDTTSNIQIWHPDTLQHIGTLKGHCDTVSGLVFRRNTHTLYSCSKDRSLKVWSLDEMAYVETLYGHQNNITCIDALTGEKAITSGGMDCTIRLWKIAEESQLVYNSCSFSIDVVKLLNEEIFLSGGADGILNVWNINKKIPLCTYNAAHGCDCNTGQPNWICSIATLTNTDVIASGSLDGYIKLWRLSNKFRSIDLLFAIDVEGFINDLAFTDDGKYLIATVGNEHKLGRWNTIKKIKNAMLKIPLIIKPN